MQVLNTGLSEHQDQIIQEILSTAIDAVDPHRLVLQNLNVRSISCPKVRVLAIGKAAEGMTQGAIECLGARISDGLVITKHRHIELDSRFHVMQGGHPQPDQRSLDAGMAIKAFLENGEGDSTLLFLVSGGGSALATLPQRGITLEDIRQLTSSLLMSGASIGEINVIRKHIDQLKGGGMLRLARSSQVITLILSDVIGNSIESIASGPTCADTSTFADAIQVLQNYGVLYRVPAVGDLLKRGVIGEEAETLKPGDPLLENSENRIIGDNRHAVVAACEKAGSLGFTAVELKQPLTGNAQSTAAQLVIKARELALSDVHSILVGGGESTVTVTGEGLGGRNLEVALAAVEALAGLQDTVLVTFATDGEDGPTDAAGAVVTGETYSRGMSQGLIPASYLEDNDSYTYFDAVGGLIKTGSTGTNVNDLFLLIKF